MTQHESIFAGTIRKHEWRDNPSRYAASIFERQTRFAPAGTTRVHQFARGVSFEPPAQPTMRAPHSLARLIEQHDPFQSA